MNAPHGFTSRLLRPSLLQNLLSRSPVRRGLYQKRPREWRANCEPPALREWADSVGNGRNHRQDKRGRSGGGGGRYSGFCHAQYPPVSSGAFRNSLVFGLQWNCGRKPLRKLWLIRCFAEGTHTRTHPDPGLLNNVPHKPAKLRNARLATPRCQRFSSGLSGRAPGPVGAGSNRFMPLPSRFVQKVPGPLWNSRSTSFELSCSASE